MIPESIQDVIGHWLPEIMQYLQEKFIGAIRIFPSMEDSELLVTVQIMGKTGEGGIEPILLELKTGVASLGGDVTLRLAG